MPFQQLIEYMENKFELVWKVVFIVSGQVLYPLILDIFDKILELPIPKVYFSFEKGGQFYQNYAQIIKLINS